MAGTGLEDVSLRLGRVGSRCVIVKALRLPRWADAQLAAASMASTPATYLALFGLFVAQVTGSFVIVGVQLLNADPVRDDPQRWTIVGILRRSARHRLLWWRWSSASALRSCWRSAVR